MDQSHWLQLSRLGLWRDNLCSCQDCWGRNGPWTEKNPPWRADALPEELGEAECVTIDVTIWISPLRHEIVVVQHLTPAAEEARGGDWVRACE
eukprot:1154279-Pelagomonas_calceolata.AAC.4